MGAATVLAPTSFRSPAAAALLDAKRRPPRDGLVPRTRLIRGLLEASGVPLVLLVAPAGYGKTTVIAQWDRRDKRPFAWLTLGAEDNEPGSLLASIAGALDTIEPVDRQVLDGLEPRRRISREAPSDLFRSLQSWNRSFVLVVDGGHVLRKQASFEVLTALVEQLPTGSQLALLSRSEPAMPVGRLRAHRQVVELRCRDLVMTRAEAAVLLGTTGLNLGRRDVEALVKGTEGWAVGLYLAALSLRERPDSGLVSNGRATNGRAGDDPLIADYLRDEILSALPPDHVIFLTRASVLEQLSGPACDAVLERSDSARVLAELARSNTLLFPTGSNGCYRYHGLLAKMLRAELRRLEPKCEVELHRRAAAWHADHGDVDRAVRHAVETGDALFAGGLLWANLATYIAYGHNATLQAWLDRFSQYQIAAHPALALVAASSQLAAGDRNLAEHWTSATERGLSAGTQRDLERSLKIGVKILRAGIAADGITRMGNDAVYAYGLLEDHSPWRSVCCLLAGVSRHLSRERDGARAHLEEGARRGAVAAPNVRALCLAQLALLAIEEDDWSSGEALAMRAREQVERFHLSDYPTSALIFAVSAAVRARRGRVDDAKIDAGWARHLVGMLMDFAPWYEVEVRIALAWAALRLSDVVGARTLVEEAQRLIGGTPDAILLRVWLDELWGELDSRLGNQVAAQHSLTTAELRVLQFLPTHLSFPEIAEQLNVSANTIKTHARALYRKLNASSRAAAVAHAQNVGLIDTNLVGVGAA